MTRRVNELNHLCRVLEIMVCCRNLLLKSLKHESMTTAPIYLPSSHQLRTDAFVPQIPKAIPLPARDAPTGPLSVQT